MKWGLKLRVAAATLVAALGALVGVGLIVTPEDTAQASTAGCYLDNGLTMYYNPETGNWLSYHSHRASGCGEVTIDWDGWSNTPDDCMYARVRTYNDGDVTLHPWKGPFCSLRAHTVRTNVTEGRQLRLEVKHASGYMQRMTIVPYLRWYY